MHEFIFALISFFLIDPLRAEMSERFGNLSQESVAGITLCLRDATPRLIQQATDDPWQTATQVVGVWSGMTAPEDILSETSPECAKAIADARAEATPSES